LYGFLLSLHKRAVNDTTAFLFLLGIVHALYQKARNTPREETPGFNDKGLITAIFEYLE